MPTSHRTPQQLARIAKEIGDLIECMGADYPESVISNAGLQEVKETFKQIVQTLESFGELTERMNPMAVMMSEMLYRRVRDFDANKFVGLICNYDGRLIRMTMNGHGFLNEAEATFTPEATTEALRHLVPPAYEESTSTSEEEPPTYTPAPKPKPSKKKKNKKNKNRRK